MALLVEKVLATNNSTAVIEAPVGTGKTFAYMVPAILRARFSDVKSRGITKQTRHIDDADELTAPMERVIISTAKKALQDQIVEKDAPFLKGAIPAPNVQVSIRKGANSYACVAKIRKHSVYKDNDKARDAILDWAKSGYGDVATITIPKPIFWDEITAENCIGGKCRFADECGYMTMKRDLLESQIAVVNHHMLAQNIRMGGRLLGEFDTVIIDEAHQAESAFRGAFTDEVTSGSWGRIRSELPSDFELKLDSKKDTDATLTHALNACWDKVWAHVQGRDGALPANPLGEDGKAMSGLLALAIKAIDNELRARGCQITIDEYDDEEAEEGSRVAKRIVPALPGTVVAGKKITEAEENRTESLIRASIAFDIFQDKLDRFAEPNDSDVTYAETRTVKGHNSTKLVLAPISVASRMGKFFNKKSHVIVTSGTIAVGTSFQHIISALGLKWTPPKAPPDPLTPLAQKLATLAGVSAPAEPEEEKRELHELQLPSPYDMHKKALLYAPRHLPMPISNPNDSGKPAYYDALAREIYGLTQLSRGNAFVLFTATTDLNEIYLRLMTMSDGSVNYIEQGANAQGALREFMATPNSVILGLKSFWEGVDVQGDKLRLVIVTKLPFGNPYDPVTIAKGKRLAVFLKTKGWEEGPQLDAEIWKQLNIPPMIIELRQGLGRLIRSKTDRGVCAILDPRIWTGSGKYLPKPNGPFTFNGYGATAIAATGLTNRTHLIANVKLYLDHIHNTEKL